MTISTKPWCFWKGYFFKKTSKCALACLFCTCIVMVVYGYMVGRVVVTLAVVSDHVTLVGDDIGLFEDHGQVIRHEGLSVIVNGNHF